MLRLFFLESIFTFLLLTLRRYTAADRLLVPEGIICPVVSVLAIILVPLVYLPPIDFIISCPSILLIKSVPAEGYSRNALWALNLISTFSFFLLGCPPGYLLRQQIFRKTSILSYYYYIVKNM